MADYVTLETIREAYARISPYVKRTPLIRAEKLERLFGGAQIYLKLENLQLAGSFKIRGVVNKMLSLSEAQLGRGVAAASSGNHAQAVAYMAARLKAKCVIVMPENAPAAKVDATLEYGAEVVLHGRTVVDRENKCGELIEQYGYTLVHSFADATLIAGHGTIAFEAAGQTGELKCGGFDEIVIPSGGGAIVSGNAVAAKGLMPGVTVTAVEPEAISLYTISLRENRPVTVEMGETVADGLRVNRTDAINFALIKKHADRVLTVTDPPIRRAVREALMREHVLAEPSACIGIAAALDGKIDMGAGRSVCFIISGGNMDAGVLADILSERDN